MLRLLQTEDTVGLETIVFRGLQNFEPNYGICCFAMELLFWWKLSNFGKYTLEQTFHL